MTNQLGQVLLSYRLRATSSFFSGLMAFMAIVWTIVVFSAGPIHLSLNGAWMAMFAPALVTLHLKQQVISCRERRLPDAAFAHVVVALALLLVLGPPVVRMAFGKMVTFGSVGIYTVVAATAVLGVAVQSLWLLAAMFLFTFMLVPLRWGSTVFSELGDGKHELVGLTLMLFGIAIIAAAIVALLRLTEEHRGYQLGWGGTPGQWGKPDSLSAIQREEEARGYWKTRWSSLFGPSDYSMRRCKVWATGSIWQRSKLWEAGRGRLIQILWPPAIVLLISLVPAIAETRRDSRPSRPNWNGNLLSMSLFPVVFVAVQWAQRRSLCEIELLRPVSRQRYFKEVGLAMARRTVWAWFAFIAAAVPIVGLSNGWDLTGIARFVGFTAAIQVLLFGCAIWLLRYRLTGVSMAISIPTAGIGGAIIAYLASTRVVGPSVGTYIALISVALGLVITYDAYRRWLNTEPG